MTRWPNKPPKGTRCDASKGVEEDRCGKPRVIMCKNEAVETVLGVFGYETWLCKDCADSLVAQSKMKRNPRLCG